MVCAVVTVVVSLDVVEDFVVVTVFVCEDVLVVLVEVAAFASWEVAADRVRDPDCDGVARAAVLVCVMLPLRLLLRLDVAPDPHAAQRTAHMAASTAVNVDRLHGLVDPGTSVSRWALETARGRLPADARCAGASRRARPEGTARVPRRAPAPSAPAPSPSPR